MYIVEVDSKERETEAIRHIVGSFHKEDLLAPFGFDALTFVIVEAQKPRLTPCVVGDVDILAGNLDFKNWADVLLNAANKRILPKWALLNLKFCLWKKKI